MIVVRKISGKKAQADPDSGGGPFAFNKWGEIDIICFFLINTICAFIVLGVFIRVILNVRMKNVLREAETMLKEMR